MSNLFMRTNLLLRGSIEEKSKDFKEILKMKKMAEELANRAGSFNTKKFDNTDEMPEPGEITLLIEYQSEEAKKHAERMKELMDEVEREARGFYKAVGLTVKSPAGKATGQIL